MNWKLLKTDRDIPLNKFVLLLPEGTTTATIYKFTQRDERLGFLRGMRFGLGMKERKIQFLLIPEPDASLFR